MSAPNLAEVIAEALAKHHLDEHDECAECDWLFDAADPRSFHAQFAAHQASVIAALPGIAIVRAFIRERQEYVNAARATVETNADYFRWQGHMEARRQLAQKLGLPYEFESAGGES